MDNSNNSPNTTISKAAEILLQLTPQITTFDLGLVNRRLGL
jgi:hypothetical protein